MPMFIKGFHTICFLLISVVCCAQNFIRANQLGYFTNGMKCAMISDMDAESFTVRGAQTNQVVFSAALEPQRLWNMSGENVQFADFSEFNVPGQYYLQIGTERSHPFVIADSAIFDELSVWTLKSFYLWRSSTPIEEQYATFRGTNYARAMGHPDDVVYVHRSAASEGRHVESEVSSPKGWYDAGDYGKYIVNAGFSAAFFWMAYELYPDYYANLNLNIPESGNQMPDILDELKWELDWMLTMQDPSDGGVYHKLSTLRFCGMVMPDADKKDRYVIGKSTAAALSFAATMAACARVYAPFDSITDGMSDKMLKAARRAYKWAEAHPEVYYQNPKDVFTGSYGDETLSDDFFFAAAELFITTKEKQYYDKLNLSQSFETPTWHDVKSVALLDLAINEKSLPDFINRHMLKVKSQALFDNIYKLYHYSVGHLPLRKFEWGSNGTVAANGSILGVAYNLTGEKKYLEGAQACFDYLLGRNSVDYCFVSRFGYKYPKNIHDRRSDADGIKEPLPGYLAGGPNLDETTDCGKTSYPSGTYPARAYLDEMCSYSTNEIAINWNAPLIMLIAEILNAY